MSAILMWATVKFSPKWVNLAKYEVKVNRAQLAGYLQIIIKSFQIWFFEKCLFKFYCQTSVDAILTQNAQLSKISKFWRRCGQTVNTGKTKFQSELKELQNNFYSESRDKRHAWQDICRLHHSRKSSNMTRWGWCFILADILCLYICLHHHHYACDHHCNGHRWYTLH